MVMFHSYVKVYQRVSIPSSGSMGNPWKSPWNGGIFSRVLVIYRWWIFQQAMFEKTHYGCKFHDLTMIFPWYPIISLLSPIILLYPAVSIWMRGYSLGGRVAMGFADRPGQWGTPTRRSGWQRAWPGYIIFSSILHQRDIGVSYGASPSHHGFQYFSILEWSNVAWNHGYIPMT